MCLFNAMILSIYIINYDIASRLFLKLIWLVLFLTVLSMLAILLISAFKFSANILQHLQNIQITIFSVIALFLFFEFLSGLSPGLFPLQIRSYLANEDITEVRSEMVEYLDESPFVKFQSNANIISQGYRGSLQQFVYEWKTDKLGFKNLPSVADLKQVDVVALGDSFTEGMGVAIEKTWPSILTANGYSTYNLAVQGYAPTQLEGSLRKYGLQFRPKYIIIGYCASTYNREKVFLNTDQAIQKRRFTGGIESIARAEIKGEIRYQAKYVISALYLLARQATFNLIHNTRGAFSDLKIKKDLFNPYAKEILDVGSRTSMMEEIESGSREWNSTLSAFDNIIIMANSINAKVILLYLPHRGETYYEAATGKALPDRYLEKIESNLLEQYTDKHSIIYLDLSEKFRNYVNSIIVDSESASELPYLEIDGHMSERGLALVVNEILDIMKRINKSRDIIKSSV